MRKKKKKKGFKLEAHQDSRAQTHRIHVKKNKTPAYKITSGAKGKIP